MFCGIATGMSIVLDAAARTDSTDAPSLSGFPAHYRLLDDADIAQSGRGFRSGTARVDGNVYIAKGGWPPTDWLQVPHDPKYQLPSGTYSVGMYVTKWKEFSVVNKRLDGAVKVPGNFDIQFGGTARLHPRVGNTGEDERHGYHNATFCQWVHFVMRWGDGKPVDLWVNGVRRFAVPYSDGMEDNTADWVLGGNRRIQRGRIIVSHPFGGAQFEPVVFTGRLTDQQVSTLYKAQFGYLPVSRHRKDTRGKFNPFGTKIPDTAFYDCNSDPTDVLPKSLSALSLLPGRADGAAVPAPAPAPKWHKVAAGAARIGDIGPARPKAVAMATAAAAAVADPDPVGLPAIGVTGEGTAAFAHAFARGDLPAGMGLQVDGRIVQVDEKALYPDGSVRHALLASPAVSGRMQLTAKASCDPRAAARRLVETNWPFRVEVNGTSIALADLLDRDLKAGRLDVWRSCPLVSEYRVVRRIDKYLEAVFDIQAFADGPVGVTMTLDRGFVAAGDEPVSYRVVHDGEELDGGAYTHWGKTRWWRTYWPGAKPTAHARHSPAYLTRTGATPRFDVGLDITVPTDGPPPVGPMQAPLNKLNMPETGQTAHGHVGLMPVNAIRYIIRPTENLLDLVRAYADGAASIGWFWREGDRAVLQTGGIDRGVSRTGEWKVDEAHQPAFFYPAYLFTGSRVYLEGLHHQANASLFDRRGDMLGGQLRAVAWKMRNLANAAYITPDRHPLKAYFTDYLNSTMQRWHADHVLGDQGSRVSGEIRGFHPRCLSKKKYRGMTSPWQEDYITLVTGWMTEMGVPLAREMLSYRANFTLGRFESHPGWHPYQGAAYRLGVMDPETCKPTKRISTWKDVFAAPKPDRKNGKSHRAGHYLNLAFGAVKSVCNALPSARARAAVDFIHDWALSVQNGRMFREQRDNPKWAIAVGPACRDVM